MGRDGRAARRTWQRPFPRVPFGEWPSPITAADVARGRLRISFPTMIGGEVWWQEGRSEEGGRVTVVRRSAGGKLTDLLPAPWNARTRVHEYGGLSYLPVPRASVRPAAAGGRAPRGHAIVFANYADQRLYVAGPEVADGKQAPHPITPDTAAADVGSAADGLDPAGLRYADFALSPGPPRDLVRPGTALRRQGHPVDRGGTARRLGR